MDFFWTMFNEVKKKKKAQKSYLGEKYTTET